MRDTKVTPNPEHFPIVGIGASAGGLRALQRLFGDMQTDTGMAFVVIVHLDPNHASQMGELLQGSTAMPVTQVLRSLAVEPNHVYIIAPDQDLAMADGELRVSARAATRPRAPIDDFLRSLAESRGAHAMGVILTGTGSDGCRGIQWIKEHGGVVLAQDPEDAEYDGMPRAAIGTGLVDVVLPLEQLAAELARVRSAAATIALPDPGEGLGEGETVALRKILGHVRSQSGQDFSGYKAATVLRRLERRMQLVGTANLTEYLELLRSSPAETGTLFNDFLICVTSFFREAEAFAALEREVVPRLFAGRDADSEVRAWVAGCATGEEAYSVAMLLTEHAEQLDAAPRIRIFATDVHEKSLAFAREGLYPESVAAELPAARLERFFVQEQSGYRVRKVLREKVLFASHDLLKDPPFKRLDLVSCRNVLIYFQREAQQRLLEVFHFALCAGGHLFLGGSESTEAAPKLFAAVDKKRHIFRALDGPHPMALRAVPSTAPEHAPASLPGATRPPPATYYGALHQQLVEAYAPPSLVVGDDEQVVHISTHAGRFLRHAGGVPTNRLLDMVEGELRLKLRMLLRAALRTGAPAEAHGVRFEIDGTRRLLTVSVRPLPGSEGTGTFLLVVFDEQGPERAVQPKPADDEAEGEGEGEGESDAGRDATIEQLEEELKEARALLATAAEEHDATIEELRASNEELQSISEEQRAVTEELEASKEELQSINEELLTVNQEHRSRNEELAQANSDLINLIDSTDIGTLFLDRELRIRRYTPPVAQVFNLIGTDVGRPLSHVTHRLDYRGLEDDVRAVLDTLARIEREAGTADGRWFVVRLSPYRSVDDRIDGVVLTLVDTTARKHAELEREELLRRAEEASTAKTNFIGAMSHEFGTPLNAIVGYAENLRDGAVGPISELQKKQLQRISANAWHLQRMVKEILASAGTAGVQLAVERGTVDLAELVRDVAGSIETLVIARGLTLDVDVPDAPTIVRTDPTKLRQILVNLLGNAIRFTDHGSVSVRARVEGEVIHVDVADTGVGIAPQHLERIFERFWQVDQGKTRIRGGTGLGLMISRDVARALGGDIDVASDLGKGSVFRVRLPSVTPDESVADAGGGDGAASDGRITPRGDAAPVPVHTLPVPSRDRRRSSP